MPTLLRVTLDYRSALLGHGGIARATRELARALARRDDVELHLFGHSLARAARADVLVPHARLHRLPIPSRSLPWLRRLGIGPEDLAGRARVFHYLDYVYPPLARAHAVVTMHDVAFAADPEFHGERGTRILLERAKAACQAAACVVVPSHASADGCVRELGVARDRVRVVPFGADHVPERDAASERGAQARRRAVVLGTIEPRKNHVRLLAALRLLPPERRPEVVVIGRVGWECEDIVARLAEAEREGLVRWLRDAGDDRVAEELLAADALLYPSLHEGFGFPPLEAQRRSLPVLAGDTPALHEVLGDGALFRDPRSAEALADGIERVVWDEDLRKRLAERGRAAASRLTWAAAAEGYAAAYREVLL